MKLLFLIVSTIAVLTIDCRDFQDGLEDRGSTKESEHFPDEDHQQRERPSDVLQEGNSTEIDQQIQKSSFNMMGNPEPFPEEVEGQNERILQRGRCKVRNACVALGGFCVTNTTLCSGRLVAEGCKPRGSNCTCCVPGTLETKLQNLEMELQVMKNNISNVILNQGTELDSIKEHQDEACYSPGFSCAFGQGTCRPNTCNSTTENQNGTCGGVGCKCCTTEICYSPGSSCASGQGSCRPNSCNSTTEDQSGTCGGASCKCCKTKPCFSPGSRCSSGQGICRANSCLSTESQSGTCGGASCKCCKTKPCFSPGSSCSSGQGICRANTCLSTESQSGTCGGASCKCCKTKPCFSPGSSCSSGQGICRANSCLSTESQSGTCGGASCKCCKKICDSPGSSCASGHGTCRASSCNSNEYQSGTCGGTNCKCCKMYWPAGRYGLPRSRYGCPDNSKFSFGFGWIEQDTEKNNKHDSYYLSGWVKKNRIDTHFCMKTGGGGSGNWPSGNYCIYRYGGYCPSGFSNGELKWEDRDLNQDNTYAGYIPDGRTSNYKTETNIRYCCRSDGSTSTYIKLPTEDNFILIRNSASCQRVSGKSYRTQYIKYDTENYDDDSRSSGDHPYICTSKGCWTHSTREDFKDIQVHFCYYY